jgi:recombination protein RecA
VVKNKVAPPFKEAEFDIMYGQGISVEGDVLDLAVEHKIVQKSGAWFSYGDQRLGQGRENVKQFLRDNPELLGQLRREVIQIVNPDWSEISSSEAGHGTPTPAEGSAVSGGDTGAPLDSGSGSSAK